MLTPCASDSNKKSELKRRDKEPATFGSVPGKDRLPTDWSPSGLQTVNGEHLGTDPRKET